MRWRCSFLAPVSRTQGNVDQKAKIQHKSKLASVLPVASARILNTICLRRETPLVVAVLVLFPVVVCAAAVVVLLVVVLVVLARLPVLLELARHLVDLGRQHAAEIALDIDAVLDFLPHAAERGNEARQMIERVRPRELPREDELELVPEPPRRCLIFLRCLTLEFVQWLADKNDA